MHEFSLGQKLSAEFLGTLWLVLGGCGSAVLAAAFPNVGIGLLGVSFAFGLSVLTMAYAVGHVSGGHFNPAVTVAMILDKRAPVVEGVAYIVAQIIGAIAAAVVVMLTVSQDAVKAGITKPAADITDISALVIEIIFTAIFLTVILIVSKRNGTMAVLAIPFTLVAIHFAIATTTGSSVNPARSIGSALVGGDLNQLWIYIVGPTIGGIIGYGVYKLMDGGEEDPLV